MNGISIQTAVIVGALLAALIVPIVMAEMNRRGQRPSVRPPVAPVKRESSAKAPLRLVVNKSDMDRELAALLAKDSRKSTEREE